MKWSMLIFFIFLLIPLSSAYIIRPIADIKITNNMSFYSYYELINYPFVKKIDLSQYNIPDNHFIKVYKCLSFNLDPCNGFVEVPSSVVYTFENGKIKTAEIMFYVDYLSYGDFIVYRIFEDTQYTNYDEYLNFQYDYYNLKIDLNDITYEVGQSNLLSLGIYNNNYIVPVDPNMPPDICYFQPEMCSYKKLTQQIYGDFGNLFFNCGIRYYDESYNWKSTQLSSYEIIPLVTGPLIYKFKIANVNYDGYGTSNITLTFYTRYNSVLIEEDFQKTYEGILYRHFYCPFGNFQIIEGDHVYRYYTNQTDTVSYPGPMTSKHYSIAYGGNLGYYNYLMFAKYPELNDDERIRFSQGSVYGFANFDASVERVIDLGTGTFNFIDGISFDASYGQDTTLLKSEYLMLTKDVDYQITSLVETTTTTTTATTSTTTTATTATTTTITQVMPIEQTMLHVLVPLILALGTLAFTASILNFEINISSKEDIIKLIFLFIALIISLMLTATIFGFI